MAGDELEVRCGEGLVDSTVATQLNGFVAGSGDASRRRAFLSTLERSPPVGSELRRRFRDGQA